MLWSYPRGGDLSKDAETAIDVTAYAAHLAALLGAHIIKVKPPTDHIEQDAARRVYEKEGIPVATLAERGVALGGVDIALASNLPAESGLSSSASLGVAIATAVTTHAQRLAWRMKLRAG